MIDPPPPPARAPKGKFFRFWFHPYVNLICVFATLIGLPLSVYFYVISVREPNLSFYVHPARPSLVSQEATSSLSVSYQGKELKGSVQLLQCALWNEGKAPIKHEDILEEITLRAPSTVRILQISVRNISRTITNFQVTSPDIESKKVIFDWKILEHNDGAAVDVIYEGPPTAEFSISGIVAGQPKITLVDPAVKNMDNAFKKKRAANLGVAASACGAVVPMLTSVYFDSRRKNEIASIRKFQRKWTTIMLILSTAMALLGILSAFLFFRAPNVPFTF